MKDFPVVKLTLFFIAGIILQGYLHLSIELSFILLGIFILILIIAFIFEKRRSFFAITSLIILILAMLIGYTSENLEVSGKNLIPDTIYVVKNFTAYGRIENINLPQEEGFSFLIKTDSIEAVGKIKTRVNLLCQISDMKTYQLFDRLFPGNLVKVTGTYRKGREERNPGEFDYNKYLHSNNISGTVSIYNAKDVTVTSEEINIFQNLTFTARKTLDKIITRMHTPKTSALLKGLILADRTDINFETMTQFINAGVVHILAVSGQNVGFIALIFYILFGRLNIYLRSFLTITGILLFMFITGASPSVFRASVMSIVIIFAFLSNRTTNIYNSLAVAALIILALNPSELFNPGFQLSFSAVISIAYFYPVFRRLINNGSRINNLFKYILLFACVSISAQIGTIPFTLYYFDKLSLVAIFANIIVIPLAGIITGTAVVTLLLFPVSGWIASVYASANNLFSDLLFRIVEFAGTLKYSFIETHVYSSADALLFYFFILAGIFFINSINTIKAKIIFILLILLNITMYSTLDDSEILTENKLNVYMIDVGQGDSFLIKFPDGETALIDAGEATPFFDNGERVILPLLNQLGIDKIDYGFVSHIDVDHYGGFVSLIGDGRIKKIYKPRLDTSVDKDVRFESYLKHKNIPVEHYGNREIKIGNTEIFILNDSLYKPGSSISSNNESGILKIEYGKTSFLFTGDLEERGESYYYEKYKSFLDIDVLKISHHGSKTGSSSDFIKTALPYLSLISCGLKNKFGHPSPEVLNRLKEVNSKILRTDEEGGILLQSDGIKISQIDWRNYY